MGTRADFYVRHPGRAPKWLGSIGWNGHPETLRNLRRAKTLGGFLGALDRFARRRGDWTPALAGWPWPWETSATTDFAYVFEVGDDGAKGRVETYGFGERRLRFGRTEPAPFAWPNLRASSGTTTASAPIGSARSGMILVFGLS